MEYKLCWDNMKNELAPCVQKLDGAVFIPFDPDNTSYQEYLAWLAEGNTPLPADN